MSADIDNLLDEFKGAWIEKLEQIEDMQSNLDAQAKELAALRGFFEAMSNYDNPPEIEFFVLYEAKNHNLIDENGKPTPLLTGEKE